MECGRGDADRVRDAGLGTTAYGTSAGSQATEQRRLDRLLRVSAGAVSGGGAGGGDLGRVMGTAGGGGRAPRRGGGGGGHRSREGGGQERQLLGEKRGG